MFRSSWHLEQLGGRRTIKWDVNIVNDAENKKNVSSLQDCIISNPAVEAHFVDCFLV